MPAKQTNKITVIKVFLKRKILSLETILSAYTCTHTHRQRHPHTQAFSPYKAKIDTAQSGQQTPGRPGMDEDSSTKQKTWQVYNLGKEMFLDLNESREVLSERKGKVIPCS